MQLDCLPPLPSDAKVMPVAMVFTSSTTSKKEGEYGDVSEPEMVEPAPPLEKQVDSSAKCSVKTCSYRVCRTAYVLYSSHSHYILTVFWLFLLYTRSFVHVDIPETSAK